MQYSFEEINKQYARFRNGVIAIIPVLLVAAVCPIFSLLAGLALLLAVLAFQLFWLRPQQKKYVHMVTQSNIQATVCKKLNCGAPSETDGGRITQQTIEQAQMMPFDTRIGCCLLRQGVDGVLGGMPVAICDATFGQVPSGTRKVQYASGIWFHFDLPQDTGADWRLMDRNCIADDIRQDYFASLPRLQDQPLDSTQLPDDFVFYCAPDSAGPDSRLLRQLKTLAEFSTGKAAVSLRSDQLDVFIRSRFLSLPVSIRKAPTPALLEVDPLPELNHLIRLVQSV